MHDRDAATISRTSGLARESTVVTTGTSRDDDHPRVSPYTPVTSAGVCGHGVACSIS